MCFIYVFSGFKHGLFYVGHPGPLRRVFVRHGSSERVAPRVDSLKSVYRIKLSGINDSAEYPHAPHCQRDSSYGAPEREINAKMMLV